MIESVRKASRIINCFTTEDPILGNGQVAEKLGLNRSTTHHLISTLCDEGLLMRASNGKYRLGWKLLELNNNVMFQQDIYDKAIPIVKELTQRFKGTVHIGMFDKGEVVFVLKVSSLDSYSIQTHVGARKPAYSTSAGKVLLSFNSSYLKETISRGLSRQAPNTITNTDKLKQELAVVRKTGYSISNNENDTNTYAIAAPILSYSGKTIAAVNLVGPISYMKGSHRTIMIKSIINTANSISQELGYIDI
ncbi:IclR family transcriptional regulator [Virgibacillus litoralis]|uniref:DNA-binding IclR family transcriptional regulator n=1 Tax=Virgibacillus litoralis TaxID=578221 RepID=A0ABS4H8T4_9BACI|nr:IclR family transcriptional regulator [Virgibacillus litoralis]MBP1947149.1 DNA-binding IclR family transcriptional regulator [Virgibacillus litoralis]